MAVGSLRRGLKFLGLGLLGTLGVWLSLQLPFVGHFIADQFPAYRITDHDLTSFKPVPTMSGGPQVVAGDFDGDGLPDIASFNRVGIMAQGQIIGQS